MATPYLLSTIQQYYYLMLRSGSPCDASAFVGRLYLHQYEMSFAVVYELCMSVCFTVSVCRYGGVCFQSVILLLLNCLLVHVSVTAFKTFLLYHVQYFDYGQLKQNGK